MVLVFGQVKHEASFFPTVKFKCCFWLQLCFVVSEYGFRVITCPCLYQILEKQLTLFKDNHCWKNTLRLYEIFMLIRLLQPSFTIYFGLLKCFLHLWGCGGWGGHSSHTNTETPPSGAAEIEPHYSSFSTVWYNMTLLFAFHCRYHRRRQICKSLLSWEK